MSEFGSELRVWRERQNLVQKQAADLLQVKLRSYQNWEQGSNTPGPMAQAWLRERMADEEKRRLAAGVAGAEGR